MPYEQYVALVLVFLVLLAPVLRWAKDRWMSFSVDVQIAGKPYVISGSSLGALIDDLMKQSGCSVGRAKTVIRRYGMKSLEQNGAWEILAELEDLSLEEYFLHAVEERIISRIEQVPERYRSPRIHSVFGRRAKEVLIPKGPSSRAIS